MVIKAKLTNVLWIQELTTITGLIDNDHFSALSHLFCVLWGIIILTEQRFKCAASRSAAPPWGFRRVRKQQLHLVLGTELHTFFCVRAEKVKGERGSVLGLETVTSAVPLAPLISTGSPSCPGISWNEPHTIKLKRFRGTFEGIFGVSYLTKTCFWVWKTWKIW